jgi:AraC-like DNA-binding protein
MQRWGSFPGLNLGKLAALHYPAESILFSMMNNCPTIGAALNVFIRYHRIMADNIQPVCRIVDGEVFLSWDIKWFNFPVKNHLSEALLTTYYAILTRLSNNAIIPERVMFTHEGPEESKDIKIYENWFRVPVEFRSKTNQLVLPSQALDIEIAFADEMMLAVLENYADKLITQIPSRSVWTAEVIKLINQSFFSGAVPRINDIAGKLAVSTRSLQEKLKTEETCFRDLVNQVRKKIATDRLSMGDTAICDIALMLGYSDQSALNHAFKRWTGKSPKKFALEKTDILDHY